MSSAVRRKNIVIVPKRVTFSFLSLTPRDSENVMYRQLGDTPFYGGGPPSIIDLMRFYRDILDFLQQSTKTVHFYARLDSQSRSDASLQLSFLRMVMFSMSSFESFKPFYYISNLFPPYGADHQDSVTVMECLSSLRKAMDIGILRIEGFDEKFWTSQEFGNSDWIIPRRLLVMASPREYDTVIMGRPVMKVERVIHSFNSKVDSVVRCCQYTYDSRMLRPSIRYLDLSFPNDSIPSAKQLDSLMNLYKISKTLCIQSDTGLRRACILACCILIIDYGFSGSEAMGWIMLTRSGAHFEKSRLFLCDLAEFSSSEQLEYNNTARISFKSTVFSPQKGVPVPSIELLDRYQNGPKFGASLGSPRRSPLQTKRTSNLNQSMQIRSLGSNSKHQK